MKSYTLTQLKADASRIIRNARATHQEALVTTHGKPMVLLVPVTEEDVAWTAMPMVRTRLARALRERQGRRSP
ncbi:MAG: type II toxin-antitoxin system Phd/YefM family antitoxin [Elusimicrobia bacterium]|nr:type II toxin-antitoxin system Phd/YefM family antitoxin [Elusimicrobiota bacterium]